MNDVRKRQRVIPPRAALALALALLSARAFGFEQTPDTGGNAGICVPHSAADTANIEYSRVGAANGASVSASLSCGAVRLLSGSPASLYVDYYDGNGSSDVSCTASVTGWTGLSAWSQSQHSNGTTTGFFHWSIPSDAVGYVHITCSLPPVSAGHLSYVAGFNLQ